MHIQCFFFFFFLLQVLQKQEPGAVRMDKFPVQDPLKKTNSKVSKGHNTTDHHTPVDHPVCFFFVFLYIYIY